MQPVRGLKGLFQQQFEFNPGPLIVSYAYRGQTMTLQIYGLANRTTLLTFASQEGQPRQIQQFIFPIHSLLKEISDRESYYLNQTPPLPRVRYMSTAQRLFAQQTPIEGRSYRESDHYWFDLLYHKWLDPVMALTACYELIRRGSRSATRLEELRVLRRMLNVAIRKKLLQANPCWGVEFPVAVRGLFRPHYVTWSEQRRIASHGPAHLRNIIQIITETGLRVYKELIPMTKWTW